MWILNDICFFIKQDRHKIKFWSVIFNSLYGTHVKIHIIQIKSSKRNRTPLLPSLIHVVHMVSFADADFPFWLSHSPSLSPGFPQPAKLRGSGAIFLPLLLQKAFLNDPAASFLSLALLLSQCVRYIKSKGCFPFFMWSEKRRLILREMPAPLSAGISKPLNPFLHLALSKHVSVSWSNFLIRAKANLQFSASCFV